MKNFLALLAMGSLAFSSYYAKAAEETEKQTETKTKLEQSQPKGDIDEEITNVRMRTESGSKSKYSMSFEFNYAGGSIQKPFDRFRPPLMAGGSETRALLSGDFSGRYRVNKSNSFSLGSGLSVTEPFHSSLENFRKERKASISDPWVAYGHVGKVGNWQMNTSITGGLYTSDYNVARGGQGLVSLSHVMLTNVGDSKLTAGVSFGATQKFYGSNSEKYASELRRIGRNCPSVDYLKANHQDVTSAGIYPYMEYSFSDNYSLRTVFGYFNWYTTVAEAKFQRDVNYQSVGVNISLGRDVFLYPNVQFIPEAVAPERTNVAVSATINL